MCTAGAGGVVVTPDVDHGPQCQVVVDGIPNSAVGVAVSIEVANTDFGSVDEYAGVQIGSQAIGGNYLEHDGQDANCDKMSRILDEFPVPSEVEATALTEGKLTVSINTTRTVNCCPCHGYVLYAEVVVTWYAEVAPNYNPIPVDGWPTPAFWKEYQQGEDRVKLQYSVSTLEAGIGAAHFQDFPADAAVFDEYSASFSPHSLVGSEHLKVLRDTKDHEDGRVGQPALFTFRLSMMIGGRRVYGPQSNHIIVLPRFLKTNVQAADHQHTLTSNPTPMGSMIVATWYGDVFRVLRVNPSGISTPGGGWGSTNTATETPLGHFVTSQVRQGVTALDSTEERLFAIVEPLDCDPLSGQHELLVVDVRQPGGGGCRSGDLRLLDRHGDQAGYTDETRQLHRIRIGVKNVSLWNIQFDEQDNQIIAVALRDNRTIPSTLVSINVETGHTTNLAALPAPPSLAVSAFSRVERVYYYVDTITQDIRRIKLPVRAVRVGPRPQEGHDFGEHLPPLRRRSEADSTTSEHVIAMAHTEFQDLLYALEGPWPLADSDRIALVVYNPRRGSQQARYVTSLNSRDFAFGVLPQVAFKISEGQISIFSASGGGRREMLLGTELPEKWQATHTIYTLSSNTTAQAKVDWLSHSSAHPHGRPVFFGSIAARYPEISAIGMTPMPPQHLNSTFMLTITGANFGLRDSGQVVRVGGIDCVHSGWISDYAITCKIPDFAVQDTVQAASTLMAASNKVNLTVHVPLGNDTACWVVSRAATAIISIETWDRISPSSSSSLAYPQNITIGGRGFHEPYTSYRCILSTDNHAVMSGAPLIADASALVFAQPLWIASAARTTVSLRRIDTGPDSHIYTPDTTVHFAGAPYLKPYESEALTEAQGSSSIFAYEDAYEKVSASAVKAAGGEVITVTGAGFVTGDCLKFDSGFFVHGGDSRIARFSPAGAHGSVTCG